MEIKEKLKALEGKKVFLITKLGNFRRITYEVRGEGISLENGFMAISQIESVEGDKNGK